MRFPAAVAVALLFAALPAPAEAAGCVWTPAGLPDHPSVERESVTGMSPDGTIAVGDGTVASGAARGIVWRGSTAADLPDEGWGPSVDVVVYDVNNAGVVVGYLYDNDNGATKAFRFHDGTYEWLQVPAGRNGMANFVNERGDIAGWTQEPSGASQAVIWPAGTAQPLVIGSGQPAGLDEEGRVVTTGSRIWFPDGTIRAITDLRGAYPRQYANGHAVGTNHAHQIIEWNLDGAVTRVLPGAVTVEAVNAHGLIAGLHVAGGKASWAIWTDGVPQDIDGYVVGITDSGIAYGQRGPAAVTYTCR